MAKLDKEDRQRIASRYWELKKQAQERDTVEKIAEAEGISVPTVMKYADEFDPAKFKEAKA